MTLQEMIDSGMIHDDDIIHLNEFQHIIMRDLKRLKLAGGKVGKMEVMSWHKKNVSIWELTLEPPQDEGNGEAIE